MSCEKLLTLSNKVGRNYILETKEKDTALTRKNLITTGTSSEKSAQMGLTRVPFAANL
jgi:hypothetical protein